MCRIIDARIEVNCSTSCMACFQSFIPSKLDKPSVIKSRPNLLTSAKPVLSDEAEKVPPKKLRMFAAVDPRMVGLPLLSTPVLRRSTAIQLREGLPGMFRYMDWHLSYSPEVHGISLQTLYRQQKGPNFLVMRDNTGCVFGAFTEAPWKPTRGGFGGVNDFAFRQKDENADVEIFRPFGSCRTQWAEPETMGVDTAIVINEDLHSGTSMPSKVFNTSSSLSLSGEQFTIEKLVCWSLRYR